MPYLQVDLDALHKFDNVDRAAGLTDGRTSASMLRLWRDCWADKRDTVSEAAITALFPEANRERVLGALVIFGFLEHVEGISYRVRGAKKRLGLLDSRRAAGHKGGKRTAEGGSSFSNLRQFAEASASELIRSTEATEQQTPKPLHPASNIQHPALKKETLVGLSEKGQPVAELSLNLDVAKNPTPAEQVFTHWVSTMGKNANVKFVGKRLRAVKARLAEGASVEKIKLAITGCSLTPHNNGQKNGLKFDDLELICRDDAQLERFAATAAAKSTKKTTDWDPDAERAEWLLAYEKSRAAPKTTGSGLAPDSVGEFDGNAAVAAGNGPPFDE